MEDTIYIIQYGNTYDGLEVYKKAFINNKRKADEVANELNKAFDKEIPEIYRYQYGAWVLSLEVAT